MERASTNTHNKNINPLYSVNLSRQDERRCIYDTDASTHDEPESITPRAASTGWQLHLCALFIRISEPGELWAVPRKKTDGFTGCGHCVGACTSDGDVVRIEVQGIKYGSREWGNVPLVGHQKGARASALGRVCELIR
jgi:hypothetical protein